MMMLSKMMAISLICFIFIGCQAARRSTDGTEYFTSPPSAVEQITVMLEEKDWPRLAGYYDLSDTSIDRAAMVSGEFFYTDEQPEAAHPAGFWHYKHPFPPEFKFFSSRELDKLPGIVEVVVMVEIDQGDGMTQVGLQKFRMRKSKNGYQLLP